MEAPYKKIKITVDSLLGCRFFADLAQTERARIERHCEGRCYEKGVEIIRHAEKTRDVFFILAGRVEASMLSASGDIVSFQEIGEGEMFGELAALDNKERSSSVRSIGEVRVIRIAGSDFKDIITLYPVLADAVMLRLCSLSRFLVERLFEAQAFMVLEQVRLEICRIVAEKAGAEKSIMIKPSPPQHAVAGRVGTNRSQVTREVGNLVDEGLMIVSSNCWQIDDVPKFLAERERIYNKAR